MHYWKQAFNIQTIHIAPLHWCCDVRPHTGPALYTKWISVQPPIEATQQQSSDNPGMQHKMPYIAFA